jgi:hypothetical protein
MSDITKLVPPLEGGWEDVMQAAIARFDVAAAVGGTACWNSVGSRAMAELLKELCRHVDAARAALPAVDVAGVCEEAVQAEREAIADLIERIFAASDGVELRLSRNSEFITLTEIVAAIRAGKGGDELGKKLAEWVLRK